ncbi:VOC family protein [Hazenella coriacea]|uniref:PhnB protein n=1 Tax=Hazenella coriacea TaxID=1179467 RepID=A0A4R3LEU6_9BACL|nr:VOC family protein [Hazenella coriacea]TCS96874.1 PhnB protein [Hazenella coriacea]
MAIDVYINFNGNCREAVEYYAQVFETEPQIMTFNDAPPNPEFTLPEEVKDFVMHARLNIRGSNIMFSDVLPDMPFVAGNNISLSISSEDMDEIQSLFHKLKEDGTVIMDLQETFWSKCYGNLTDKFGIGWQLNHESGTMGM